MSNQLWKFWIPLVIVAAAVGCMAMLHFAWEKKYSALGVEYQDVRDELTLAERERDSAVRDLASLQRARAEDERRVAVMVGQIEALQKNNADIVAKNNENIRIAEQNRLAFEVVLADRDRAIQEANATIKNLIMKGGTASSPIKGEKPIDSEFTVHSAKGENKKETHNIDTKEVAAVYKTFRSNWDSIVSQWSTIDPINTPQGKKKMLDLYDICIRQLIVLKKLDQGNNHKDAMDCILGLRPHLRNNTIPERFRAQSSYKQLTNITDPPLELVDVMADNFIQVLEDHKKIIEGVPVKRQKGEVYKPRIRRVYP